MKGRIIGLCLAVALGVGCGSDENNDTANNDTANNATANNASNNATSNAPNNSNANGESAGWSGELDGLDALGLPTELSGVAAAVTRAGPSYTITGGAGSAGITLNIRTEEEATVGEAVPATTFGLGFTEPAGTCTSDTVTVTYTSLETNEVAGSFEGTVTCEVGDQTADGSVSGSFVEL